MKDGGKMNTSESIKYFRQKRGITQKQLAEKTGLSIATIQGYEQNKYNPKLEQLRRIAAAFNVSMADLKPDLSIINTEELSTDITKGLALDELGLLQDYRTLNEIGKYEVRKRTEELTKIPEYRKETD